MCQTTDSDLDDMDEISSTSRRKTGRLIEPRKIRKPLMEKKRRARINQSLDELKRIVVDAEKLAGQDLSRVNKLEKADILEMTVRYLKRRATPPPPPPPSSRGPDVYLAGYQRCIGQVQELLAEQWSDERRQQSGRRMVEHLEACVRRLDVPAAGPRARRSSWSSSDESAGPPSSLGAVARRDDDGDGPQRPAATAVSPRPSPDRSATEFRDVPPKSMWRPW